MKKAIPLLFMIIAIVLFASACASEQKKQTDDSGGSALVEIEEQAADETVLNEETTQAETSLPTDGDRIVFAGTIHFYTTQELLDVEGVTNPNAVSAYLQQYPDRIFCILELEEPQTMEIKSLVWNGEAETVELTPQLVERIGLESYIDGYIYDVDFIESFRQYEGECHIFSIDPNNTGNLHQDVHLPTAPLTNDVHVLD